MCSFSLPKKANKRYPETEPSQPRRPPYTTHAPGTQHSRFPPRLKQVQNQNKRCITGFRWQWLSPSGQLLGTPERGIIAPETPTRASCPTVPRASAQLLARPSLPSALEMGSCEGGEEKGVGKTQGQNDSGTSREEKRPDGMLGVESYARGFSHEPGDRRSEPRQAASGRPGPRRRRLWATLPSLLSPSRAEGP